MQIKYAVLNPLNGSYTYKDTYEDAIVEISTRALDVFVNHHCNGSPCTYVEVQDNGDEIWRNNEGIIVPNPEDIKREMEAQAILMTRTYADLPKVTL